MRRVEYGKGILEIGKGEAARALLSLVPELCALYWKYASQPVVAEVADSPIGPVVVTKLDYTLDGLITDRLREDFRRWYQNHVLSG